MELNINLSTFKRSSRSIKDVEEQFEKDGWTETGKAGPRENVLYYQKTGVNITVIDGPLGVTVIPSGPVRGSMFGDSLSAVSGKSDIFEPAKNSDDMNNPNVSATQHT